MLNQEGKCEHNHCVESYISALANNDIEVGLNKMEFVRRQQVLGNRSVVDAIINCIKYLSQQGMGFK